MNDDNNEADETIEGNRSKSTTSMLPIGISIGLMLGVAIGLATDKLAIGISLGLALGSALGVVMHGARSKKAAKSD